MKFCILCGGDHEPSVDACMANEAGMDRRIKQIGVKAWNRLSGRAQRVWNTGSLKELNDEIAALNLGRRSTRT